MVPRVQHRAEAGPRHGATLEPDEGQRNGDAPRGGQPTCVVKGTQAVPLTNTSRAVSVGHRSANQDTPVSVQSKQPCKMSVRSPGFILASAIASNDKSDTPTQPAGRTHQGGEPAGYGAGVHPPHAGSPVRFSFRRPRQPRTRAATPASDTASTPARRHHVSTDTERAVAADKHSHARLLRTCQVDVHQPRRVGRNRAQGLVVYIVATSQTQVLELLAPRHKRPQAGSVDLRAQRQVQVVDVRAARAECTQRETADVVAAS